MHRKPVSDRYYGGAQEPTRRRRDSRRVLLDERQASRLLKISDRTLQAWRVRGTGPKFVRLGSRVLYRLSDLDEFVEQSIRRSTSDPGSGSDSDPDSV